MLFLLAVVSSSRNASSSPVALAHSVDLASLAVFASAGSSGVLCTAAPNVPLVNVGSLWLIARLVKLECNKHHCAWIIACLRSRANQ